MLLIVVSVDAQFESEPVLPLWSFVDIELIFSRRPGVAAREPGMQQMLISNGFIQCCEVIAGTCRTGRQRGSKRPVNCKETELSSASAFRHSPASSRTVCALERLNDERIYSIELIDSIVKALMTS